MDEKQVIEKNELKQVLKAEFDSIIKQDMLAILNKHNVSPSISERITKDLCIWSNMTIDCDLN